MHVYLPDLKYGSLFFHGVFLFLKSWSVGSELQWLFALAYSSHLLWFWPLGKTWYHHTSLSSASLSQRLPILLDIFLEWESWSQPYHMFLYCPLAWSCPQVFNTGLGMRLCEGRFDKEVISCRIVFGIPKLFQTQKSFWHRFKANSFWRNSSASYGEVIRSDKNPNRKNVK